MARPAGIPMSDAKTIDQTETCTEVQTAWKSSGSPLAKSTAAAFNDPTKKSTYFLDP
jgi:hypothetical protein